MPVFVLKAKDALSVSAVKHYRDSCSAYGLHEQADEVREALREFQAWQTANPDVVKMPDHKHVPATAAEPC